MDRTFRPADLADLGDDSQIFTSVIIPIFNHSALAAHTKTIFCQMRTANTTLIAGPCPAIDIEIYHKRALPGCDADRIGTSAGVENHVRHQLRSQYRGKISRGLYDIAEQAECPSILIFEIDSIH